MDDKNAKHDQHWLGGETGPERKETESDCGYEHTYSQAGQRLQLDKGSLRYRAHCITLGVYDSSRHEMLDGRRAAQVLDFINSSTFCPL